MRFRTIATIIARNQTIVGVMRLMHMLGERDGHSGLFPFVPSNYGRLHSYPLRLWRFPEGMHVIRSVDPTLGGARVVSIGGLPMAEVEARVRPLVPRDNEWSSWTTFPTSATPRAARRVGGATVCRSRCPHSA